MFENNIAAIDIFRFNQLKSLNVSKLELPIWKKFVPKTLHPAKHR